MGGVVGGVVGLCGLACPVPRGKSSHPRIQHLRNHRGFSVAISNGVSLFSGSFQRTVTCPVDLLLKLSNGFSVAFSHGCPFLQYLGDVWCVIVCPNDVCIYIITYTLSLLLLLLLL